MDGIHLVSQALALLVRRVQNKLTRSLAAY